MTPTEIEVLASGPVLSVDEIIGKETTANGHTAANGTAKQVPAATAELGSGLTFDNATQEWVSGLDIDAHRNTKAK